MGCGQQARILMMMTMNFTYFLVELIVGSLGNSTTLVADSFHMLSDVAALVIAFIAVLMSPRKWSRSTFGFARAEVLGAFANCVFLLGLCFSIILKSVEVKFFCSLKHQFKMFEANLQPSWPSRPKTKVTFLISLFETLHFLFL